MKNHEKSEKSKEKIHINYLKLYHIFILFKSSIIFVIILYIINDFSHIFSPYLMSRMLKAIEGFYLGQVTLNELIKINIINTGIWSLWICISFYSKFTCNLLLNKIEVYVKKQLFNLFQMMNYEDFIKISAESAISNVKVLEYAIKEIFSIFIVDIFSNLFTILCNMFIIYKIIPQLTYLTICWAMLHYIFLSFGFKKNHINNKNLLNSKFNLNNNILETLLNILMIKSNNTLEYEQAKLNILCNEYTDKNKKFVFFSEFINHSGNLICEVLLWGGGFLIILKILVMNKMPVSNIMYLFMVIYNIVSKVRNISIRIGKLFEHLGEYNNIINYLKDFKIYRYDNTNIMNTINNIPIIQFKNVNLKYEDEQILNNVNFEILQGEKVCIIGSSGSGKSTIANLISGLYKNYSGEILIKGHEIKNINMEDIIENVSIINQSPTIFSRTVRENLIEDKEISEDKLVHYTKIACIYDFIMDKLSDGFETKINQKTMSGGQAQRLCLARLLLREKNIKIFDEATNGLDKKNKKLFLDALLKDQNYHFNVKSNDTLIFIDHSLEFLEYMDRIILISDGVILYNGNYTNLNNSIDYQYFIKKI